MKREDHNTTYEGRRWKRKYRGEGREEGLRKMVGQSER